MDIPSPTADPCYGPEINENHPNFPYALLQEPPEEWELYDIPDKTHLRNRALDVNTFKKLVRHHTWGFDVVIGERKTKERLLQVLKRIIFNQDENLRPTWHEFVSRKCDAGPRLLRESYHALPISRAFPDGVHGEVWRPKPAVHGHGPMYAAQHMAASAPATDPYQPLFPLAPSTQPQMQQLAQPNFGINNPSGANQQITQAYPIASYNATAAVPYNPFKSEPSAPASSSVYPEPHAPAGASLYPLPNAATGNQSYAVPNQDTKVAALPGRLGSSNRILKPKKLPTSARGDTQDLWKNIPGPRNPSSLPRKHSTPSRPPSRARARKPMPIPTSNHIERSLTTRREQAPSPEPHDSVQSTDLQPYVFGSAPQEHGVSNDYIGGTFGGTAAGEDEDIFVARNRAFASDIVEYTELLRSQPWMFPNVTGGQAAGYAVDSSSFNGGELNASAARTQMVANTYSSSPLPNLNQPIRASSVSQMQQDNTYSSSPLMNGNQATQVSSVARMQNGKTYSVSPLTIASGGAPVSSASPALMGNAYSTVPHGNQTFQLPVRQTRAVGNSCALSEVSGAPEDDHTATTSFLYDNSAFPLTSASSFDAFSTTGEAGTTVASSFGSEPPAFNNSVSPLDLAAQTASVMPHGNNAAPQTPIQSHMEPPSGVENTNFAAQMSYITAPIDGSDTTNLNEDAIPASNVITWSHDNPATPLPSASFDDAVEHTSGDIFDLPADCPPLPDLPMSESQEELYAGPHAFPCSDPSPAHIARTCIQHRNLIRRQGIHPNEVVWPELEPSITENFSKMPPPPQKRRAEEYNWDIDNHGVFGPNSGPRNPSYGAHKRARR